MNILLDFEKDLNSIWSNVNILLWINNLKDFKQIVSYDVDFCSFLKRARLNKANMLNAWITNFLKSGNMSRKCPILKVNK